VATLTVPVRYGAAAGRWVLVAAVLGSGMAFIDGTVVNIALPTIGDQLGAGTAGLQWVVNAYTLTLSAFILLGGSLGDRFGRRRIFLIGVTWFAVASLLCGLAPGIGTLVAARALQGVGGALLTPGSLAILQSVFDREDRTRAIGAWSGLAGIAGAIGPFLGGWLVQVSSWRLIFFINVPIALAVLAVSVRWVPETANPDAARQLDIPGALLAALGLAGLTYGLTAWGAHGGVDALIAGALVVGVLGLAAFVTTEARTRHPMLPLGLFRVRTFSAVNLVTFAVYAALSGVFFLLVVQLQVVSGYGPVAAGLALFPVTVLMLVLSARAGALASRIGPRIPMTVGPLLCAAALLLLSRIGAHAPYWSAVFPAVVLLGLGLSATVAPLTSVALSSAQDRNAGLASGVNNAVARTAGLLAVAVLPLVSGVGSSLTDPGTLAPAYRMSMWICAGLLAVGGVLALASIPNSFETIRAEAEPTPVRTFCPVCGPPLHPDAPRAEATAGRQ
jgi:EmrB/QacA subfamily drug resistance transporter